MRLKKKKGVFFLTPDGILWGHLRLLRFFEISVWRFLRMFENVFYVSWIVDAPRNTKHPPSTVNNPLTQANSLSRKYLHTVYLLWWKVNGGTRFSLLKVPDPSEVCIGIEAQLGQLPLFILLIFFYSFIFSHSLSLSFFLFFFFGWGGGGKRETRKWSLVLLVKRRHRLLKP